VLWRLRKKPRPGGWLFGVWMILASVERLLIEFLRAKDDRFIGPFTLAQAISVVILAAGILIVVNRRGRRERPPAAEAA